jgi:hypothetical protein
MVSCSSEPILYRAPSGTGLSFPIARRVRPVGTPIGASLRHEVCEPTMGHSLHAAIKDVAFERVSKMGLL